MLASLQQGWRRRLQSTTQPANQARSSINNGHHAISLRLQALVASPMGGVLDSQREWGNGGAVLEVQAAKLLPC